MARLSDAKATYQIQDFALHNQVIQAIHDLLDATGVVPPMDIENIDIVSPQFLERRFKGDVQGLQVIPDIRRLLFDTVVASLVVRSILNSG